MPCLLFMITLHSNHQKYNMPQTLHIAIIGGGAAGFFAAIEAKRNFPHADITIFEKNSKVLAKVEITGGRPMRVSAIAGFTQHHRLSGEYRQATGRKDTMQPPAHRHHRTGG